MAMSAAGPEGIPPIVVSPGNQIMDGAGAGWLREQLQWDGIGVMRRPESERRRSWWIRCWDNII
jgi:hypothetical protein